MRTARESATKILALLLLMGVSLLATAQGRGAIGVMVDVSGTGWYVVVNNQLYRFDPDNAATYYSSRFQGTVNVSCTAPCTAAQPTTPATPALSPQAKSDAVSWNAPAFMNGGNVGDLDAVQNVKVTATDGTVWTFSYHFALVPISDFLPPLTGWDFIAYQDTSTTAHVVLGVEIANEYATAQASKLGYSFPVSLGNTGLLKSLTITADSGPAQSVTASAILLAISCTINGPSAHYLYQSNAAQWGSTSLLRDGDMQALVCGNTQSGPGGYPKTNSTARNVPPGRVGYLMSNSIALDLAPGDHIVRVTGIVSSIPFAAARSVHVLYPPRTN